MQDFVLWSAAGVYLSKEQKIVGILYLDHFPLKVISSIEAQNIGCMFGGWMILILASRLHVSAVYHRYLGGSCITRVLFLVYHKCSARGAFLGIFCFCRLLIILDSNWQQLRLSWIEIKSKVLFVKTLLAKVKELKFACKVFPHYVFGCLKKGVVKVQNSFFYG